jgi:alpha/beta superfamily hydrolase
MASDRQRRRRCRPPGRRPGARVSRARREEPAGSREGVWLRTADGVDLEAELRLPREEPVAGVAFAHPHPRHGGTMGTILVPRAGDALQAAGYGFVRWNFRGAGRSGGEHDDGVDEQHDVRAALDLVAGRCGGRVVLAGWSFGADVSLCAAPTDERVLGVVAVAPPLWYLGDEGWDRLAAWGRPVRFVLAEHDRYRPEEEARELAAGLPDVGFEVVPGAGHLFTGRLEEAAAAIVAAVVAVAPPAGRG